MPAYVRVSKLEALVAAVDAHGTQTDVAARAGISTQRLNQLYVGRHDVISIDKAARLEDTLGVPRGSLFVAIDADQLGPYVAGPTPGPEGATQQQTDSDPGAAGSGGHYQSSLLTA